MLGLQWASLVLRKAYVSARVSKCAWLRRIRDKIDKMMQKDRALSLLIAMESALEDDRFEVGPLITCSHVSAC